MKSLVLFLGICLSIVSCSNKNDFDSIVSNEWDKCNVSSNCTIDFEYLMNFEWDTMCFYSGANSLEDINSDLGFELKKFTDIGDRVIFLKKGKMVYQKEWFYKPSKPREGTVFVTDLKRFRVSKLEAKFEIKKEGRVFFLKKL